LQIGNTDLKG